MIIDSFFYFFSCILIIASVCVVYIKNPVVSVLSLIVCFFNAAAIFILLNAEYLAFTLVIVYVGAVAVLFLFVVMLLAVKNEKNSFIQSHKKVLFCMAFLLLGELLFVFVTKNNCCVHDDLSIFSMSSIEAETNIHALAQLLYTHYFLAFQLSGIVLLIAMIGAIVLVYEKTNSFLRQNIRAQLMRTKQDTLEIVKVKPKTKRKI